MLWGDEEPAAAAATLQSHLSRLRRLLYPEGEIGARGGGYCLELSAGVVDAEEFMRLSDEALALTEPGEAARAYAAALGWWRGPAFGELADHDGIRAEAVRLEERRHTAIEQWVECRLAAGGDAAAVSDLEGLTAEHPLRERYWRQLMVALYQTGRQADALRRAAELRSLLRDELGLSVSPALRELEARILADDPTLLPAAPAAPSAAHGRPIADDPSPLVGRDEQLAQLAGAVRADQLVTLVGPGGVGKTRLARRLAATCDDFHDGVAVVELAAVRDPAALSESVAAALDVQQRQHLTVEDTVLAVLASRRQLLLVLDNCEHLLDAVVPLVERIRTRCHTVHVLATSRAPLGLPGEIVSTIAPLAVAPPDVTNADGVASAPATQLLLERATAASPGFALTDANAPVVAELCRRLDGLPLALELAAARLRSLGPENIVERLGTRSHLLDAGPHAIDVRHRTLRDTIGWSYELLNTAERTLFNQLSVFAGSFDLPAVEAVCGLGADQGAERATDVVDVLVALVDKSMVQVIPDPRYQLLETLREYGREQLEDVGGVEAVGARHLRWFVDLAERAGEGMAGPDEAMWSRQIEADFDNFRAAHAWAVHSGDVDAALRLVAGLREYAFRRIRYELTSWAATAATLPGAPEHPLYAVVLATVAYGHFVRGELANAIEVGHQAVAASSRCDSSGLAERTLGNALFYLGRVDEALAWMDQVVASAHASGSSARLAHALYMRSVAETSVGRTVRGAVLAGEAQAAARTSLSPTASAQADYALGLALEGTEPAESLQLLRHAAITAATAGNRWVEAFAATEVWWLEARTGELRQALTGSGAVIDTWQRGGDWANLWLSLRHVVGLLQQIGDDRAAAVLHGALDAAGATHALPFEPSDAEHLTDIVEQLRTQLGSETFERAATDGSAMPEPELIAYIQERITALTNR